MSLSCGVVSTSIGTITSSKKFIAIADSALYQAKEQGRDRPILADKAFE